ncbi:hypothetical protein [Larkinella humicola]|uniref:Uncharacterized protein n=1 Tax=Larkinella humicola TaxID=2607654 RepID=A0A5N1JBR6_9BACT|nr:hypothetical protein [Larkinella humicola]KAA9346309.1 hypothetical protein F0P93_29010 [Larkinella humicola]
MHEPLTERDPPGAVSLSSVINRMLRKNLSGFAGDSKASISSRNVSRSAGDFQNVCRYFWA